VHVGPTANTIPALGAGARAALDGFVIARLMVAHVRLSFFQRKRLCKGLRGVALNTRRGYTSSEVVFLRYRSLCTADP
jgi:hypothetical protein